MKSSAVTCKPFVPFRGRDGRLYELFVPILTGFEENVNMLEFKIESSGVLVAVLWSYYVTSL
jgi:hypothetical protein